MFFYIDIKMIVFALGNVDGIKIGIIERTDLYHLISSSKTSINTNLNYPFDGISQRRNFALEA